MSDAETGFARERHETFDILIATLAPPLAATPSGLLLAPDGNSSVVAKPVAELQVWELFSAALRQMRETSLAGEGLRTAFKKVSLRNSLFARSLLVEPPSFDQVVFDSAPAAGRDSALLCTDYLVNAAVSDLPRSLGILQRQIEMVDEAQKKLTAASGPLELTRLRRNVQESGKLSLPDASYLDFGGKPSAELPGIHLARREALDYLDTLAEVYSDACVRIRNQIGQMQPKFRAPAPVVRAAASSGPGSPSN